MNAVAKNTFIAMVSLALFYFIFLPTFAADKGRFHLLTWGNGPCRV